MPPNHQCASEGRIKAVIKRKWSEKNESKIRVNTGRSIVIKCKWSEKNMTNRASYRLIFKKNAAE